MTCVKQNVDEIAWLFHTVLGAAPATVGYRSYLCSGYSRKQLSRIIGREIFYDQVSALITLCSFQLFITDHLAYITRLMEKATKLRWIWFGRQWNTCLTTLSISTTPSCMQMCHATHKHNNRQIYVDKDSHTHTHTRRTIIISRINDAMQKCYSLNINYSYQITVIHLQIAQYTEQFTCSEINTNSGIHTLNYLKAVIHHWEDFASFLLTSTSSAVAAPAQVSLNHTFYHKLPASHAKDHFIGITLETKRTLRQSIYAPVELTILLWCNLA